MRKPDSSKTSAEHPGTVMSRVAAPAPEVHDRNQISGTIADVSILAQDFFSAVAPSRMVKGQAIEPSDPVPNSADRSGIDISSRQEARDATDNHHSHSAVGVIAESINTGALTSNVFRPSIHVTQVQDIIVRRLWTAPSPSEMFVGREDVLHSVHNKLQSCTVRQHYMSRMVALVAPPGMGKTETARAFAQKFQAEYENIAWVDAQTERSLKASFLRMAKTLKLPCSDYDTGKDLAVLVYSHVSEHFEKPALFIFDDATGLESKENSRGIHDYLPTRVKKNVPLILLTSESAEWRSHCEFIQVSELSTKESLLFLQRVFKLSNENMKSTEGLVDLLGNLVQKLKGHPAAFSEAVAHISYDPTKETLLQLEEKVKDYIRSARSKHVQKRYVKARQKLNRNETCTTAPWENASLLAENLEIIVRNAAMQRRTRVNRIGVVVGALLAVVLIVSFVVFLQRILSTMNSVYSEGSPDPVTAVVSLQATNPRNKHFCIASIIHRKFLLSPAHCFNEYKIPYIIAVAGKYDLYAPDGNTEQVRHVIRLVTHENFDKGTFDNDIALLELSAPLNFDDKYVRPFKLWDSKWKLPQRANVTGWQLVNVGPRFGNLLAAEIKIRDHDDCAKRFGRIDRIVSSNMICAGGLQDACYGDSGAPLTCLKGSGGKWQEQHYLCGFACWGVACDDRANMHFPGVYTDVSKYTAWIEENMHRMGSG